TVKSAGKRRKRAAGKTAAKTRKPRKSAAVMTPFPFGRNTFDQTAEQVVAMMADRQRKFMAAIASQPMSPFPPLPLSQQVTLDKSVSRPGVQHEEMLKRIASLEETIAKLPTGPAGIGHNKPPEPIEPVPLS